MPAFVTQECAGAREPSLVMVRDVRGDLRWMRRGATGVPRDVTLREACALTRASRAVDKWAVVRGCKESA